MSRRSRLPLAALLLSFAGLGVAVADDSGPDPTGTWTIQEGGTVEFAPAPRGVRRYTAKWDTPSGKYEGIGLVRMNRLIVGWGKGATGVMFLTKEGEGWKGDWVAPGAEGEALGHETWEGAALEGAHAVEGSNPNGSTYAGSVACVKRDEVFFFTWTQGDKTWTGVGLKLDEEHVAIGYGNGNYGAIFYDLSTGDTVEGRWASQKDRRYAVEHLTRRK